MITSSNPPRQVVMSLVDFDRRAHRLAYPWVCTDGGRASSSRPRQRNDCTVRALAIAGGLSYDDAYDLLKEAGRKCSRGFQFSAWLNRQGWAAQDQLPCRQRAAAHEPRNFRPSVPQGALHLPSSKTHVRDR